MKRFLHLLAVVGLSSSLLPESRSQVRLLSRGFDASGVFQMAVSGAGQVEVSTNLQSWAPFATVSQETGLNDMQSRQAEWRFYRARDSSAAAGTPIGFVRITIPPGKQAVLGNQFGTPLRLNSQDTRASLFGTPNPSIKLSLYTNGNFVAHTLNPQSGEWQPPLRAINVQEGFSIENTGDSPVTVRMSGNIRPGPFDLKIPAGRSLVVPPIPLPGEAATVLGLPAKDGLQIHMFNEDQGQFQTSTYDALDNGWLPKLLPYRPGRALMIQSSEPVEWTKSLR